MQLIARRELDAELLLKCLHHIDLTEWGREVDVHGGSLRSLRMVRDLVPTRDVFDHARDKGLGEVHEVVDVCIGHVKLTRGELGVVGEVDSLIPELASDLIDTVEAANDEHLEEELRRDAHEEVELEVIVVGDEGLSGGASCDLVHHGCLDLKETKVVEEAAEVVDDLGAGDEFVADVVVHNEVEVPLTIPQFLVFEPVV
ncbi:hypothetical protein BC936DRAFT_145003 [Jimgerdemannia flammicorona]|uniref:Uncharacterized protein n=1 Tax=Jimgerdemannia flammicorona TaxID=994334 RepID=A0A433DB60_9FUNG|nr:hypothetical protein BC936DRAFT_145003 [Jimgerdemannia flammicorona]